jgi:large subunit ribosomal protein L30
MAGPTRSEPSGEAVLEVTQTRSAIGTKPKHRATLRALGLRGIGRSNRLPDRPEIRGMLRIVDHLVAVRSVVDDDNGEATAPTRSGPQRAEPAEEET